MIKDQHTALREVGKIQGASIKIRFDNERDENGNIVVKVEQDRPLPMNGQRPTGMTTGIYVPGRVPENPFDHRQMRKDWHVIRSHVRPEEVIRDPWPPAGVPIVVMFEGITEPKLGTVVEHIRTMSDGVEKTDLVFAEVLKDSDSDPVTFSIQVQPSVGDQTEALFRPYDSMNGVIAWSYLSDDNQLIPPKRDNVLELFVDCEFEDSTGTLISMALVTRDGRVYYAFDSAAADKVKDKWVQENVLNVLLEVPQGTHAVDLVSKRKDPDCPVQTFRDFVKWVITLNIDHSWLDTELIIHADFPTDIGYIAPLFHLGGGERIRPMTQINFVVDYVDSYPSGLKNPVQHNAAWDALAMWLHMGYTAYLDPRLIAKSSVRKLPIKYPDPEITNVRRGDYF